MLFAYINNIKVDFVHHPFTLLKPVEAIDNIRLFSAEDVSAMKLFAATKRASRKDFYDIYILCNAFGVSRVIEVFSKKYGEDKIWTMLKSPVYFDDADKEEDPELSVHGLTWENVKKYTKEAFSNLL